MEMSSMWRAKFWPKASAARDKKNRPPGGGGGGVQSLWRWPFRRLPGCLIQRLIAHRLAGSPDSGDGAWQLSAGYLQSENSAISSCLVRLGLSHGDGPGNEADLPKPWQTVTIEANLLGLMSTSPVVVITSGSLPAQGR